jgi:hypothetical protein
MLVTRRRSSQFSRPSRLAFERTILIAMAAKMEAMEKAMATLQEKENGVRTVALDELNERERRERARTDRRDAVPASGG